ncbi:ACT domain-containing protein [Brooklawnia cerclae]|uniref:ACT domain-containing protein n=1 Tax=Brooklawnia cerclae TaxID=349934 RepID=A0ABX0SIK3_9ACTN|nr:ACT domain-containing protein [Brooklawnia cerclae]NIH56471.1 hypothetical protein [Brooklawnia cerclae]
MLMLRVELPDRPGALGQVASAIGAVGADIYTIEIVERGDGHAVDDFMVDLPRGSLPDTLVSACTEIEGTRVLWLSRHPDQWAIESDLEIAQEMDLHRARALELLVEHAPRLFHSRWALVVGLEERRVLARTEDAPDLTEGQIAALAPLDEAHALDMPDWLQGWGDVSVALAPTGTGLIVLVGRQGGPQFLDSELHRLHRLVRLAH